ncbi:MAG: ATP-binding protein [Paracoccus sp. (in: a-proteobacteria)]|uniref:sensor histidine kinase n=1 Tax=Paracoccus sp. TaxID=267 RepID=UPI00391D569A
MASASAEQDRAIPGRWRRRLVLLGAGLALAGAALALGPAHLGRAFIAATIPQGENVLRLSLSGLRGELARYERLPELMAHEQVLADALSPRAGLAQIAAANLYLRHVNDMMGLSDSYVMGLDGTTVAASNFADDPSFVGQNFEYRPYFSDAVTGGQGRFFALGTTSAKRGYYFGAPVRDRGRIAGVLALKVDVDAIEDSWRAAEYEIIVTDAEGVVFLASRRDWHFRALAPLSPEARTRVAETRRYDSQPLAALPLQKTGAVGQHPLMTLDLPEGRREFVIVSEPMSEAGWTVQVLLDTAPAHRQALWASVGALLVLGLSAAGLAALAQRRARLRERLQMQREAQSHLESRVAARTQELAALNTRLAAEVTERRATEDELRRTQRHLVQSAKLAALGQMSAALSHELNQPLGAVRNFAANALTYLDRDRTPEARDNLGRIVKLTDRMTEIGRTLRNFARKPNSQLAVVDLHDVLRDALEVIAWRIGKRELRLDTDLPHGPLMLRAGPVRFQQVIVNLLSNALDALEGREDGQIRISAREAGDRLVLRISDNGPGVPQGLEERIFDPFFSTKGVGAGLGLGLSISFNIIKDFGGELRVVRESGGAAFEIDLPRLAPDLVSASEVA